MRELMNKAGETGQDNLIAGVSPPTEFTGIKIAAGQGKLLRGTVLAESDAGCVMLGTETTGKAAYILADDVDATEEIGTAAYRAGNFNTKALIVAEGYELTEADRDSLRKYRIVLNDNMQ
jgi:hypothetical protein